MMLTGEPYRAANAKTVRNKRWHLNCMAQCKTEWDEVATRVLATSRLLLSKGETDSGLVAQRTPVPA
ncbi:MAG: hypothetical protein CW346_13915 [Bacillaceae bacterium]|nr:hypothetical protein [Bacillaceae bacterium]